jgi:hypothetical protein
MDVVEDKRDAPVLEGRECGSCTLCCRVLGVGKLQKPPGQHCQHCEDNWGCLIYADRPNQCRDFNCGFLLMKDLAEAWRPAISKLIVVPDEEARQMRVHVDPEHPDAWRVSPYYERLKEWARVSVSERMLVVVRIGAEAIVVLPDREVELGILEDDEIVKVEETKGSAGVSLQVTKIKRDAASVAHSPSAPNS